ncbi:alpha/beta hydrolase family protein [Amycolatopsis sacchari]|uniref:alpha/beta hydrolase family protein n=1 Tax=Amycolatopsis sacchari TaxID=115433 RepID=UPI003D703C84
MTTVDELTAELVVAGGVPRELGLSPDGRLVTYRLGEEWWQVPARGGSPRRTEPAEDALPDLGDRHVVESVRRPDGGPLAVLTWAEDTLDPGLQRPELHLVEQDGTVRDLGRVEAEASSLTWWRKDGWHLVYLARTPPGLVGGLAVFDRDLATGETRNLTAGTSSCPVELAQAGDEPVVLVAEGLETVVRRIDGEEVVRVPGLAESLTAGGDQIAFVAGSRYEPPDIWCGPPFTRITDTRPELRGIRWGTQERLSYRAADGLELDGLLVLPPGKTRDDGPFSLVTIVHGGPYGRHTDGLRLGWFPSGQWLATAGHAVFLPNPRGGQGHGHEFAATVAGRVGQEEWTDILTGIDLLIAEGVADPERLGIAGWSHGGFMAAWAVTRTDRFKAALVGAGISDWGMLAATGEYGSAEAALGGSTGWEGPGPHPHDRVSPISYASRIRTPVLIVHGGADTNVPPSQAEFLHRALRHFGVPHEYVVYPGENHAIRERAHQLDLLRRTREWFGRYLRP